MLKFKTYKMDAIELNSESSLPLLSSFYSKINVSKTDIAEDEGLYIGHGFVNSAYPYKSIDNYGRSLSMKEFPCAVLENKYLKATFITSLGGRLWSLIDKETGKELLYKNPVFRAGYLATRNAWFSGGIEFNCGVWGHHPLTCEPLFTAALKDDYGNSVLRMYEFERIRSVVYQMDFVLPDDSKFLICTVRIENINSFTVPIYWWTNIAVPEIKGARVVVPADYTYTHKNDVLTKLPVPFRDGIDFTYPTNQTISFDNFWKIDESKRKYISQIDTEGYGFIQASTHKLKGRKLFVWGQQAGGAKWQEFLSGNGCDGRYCEIQAGITHTQYESLPMPSKSVLSWTEFFGAIKVKPEKIHGDWMLAREETEDYLDRILPEEKQEQINSYMQKISVKKADSVITPGSGWGNLENCRRIKEDIDIMCDHLDFTVPLSDKQEQWYYLLENGVFRKQDPEEIPASWMIQDEWIKKMEHGITNGDKENWYTYLQLGCSYYAKGLFDKAEERIEKSLSLQKSCWGLYAMSEIQRERGDMDAYVSFSVKASKLAADLGILDISIAKATASALFKTENYKALYDYTKSLPTSFSDNPRIKLYTAFGAVHTGRFTEADDILCQNGGLEVPDIKEGEISISELWFLIQEEKARAEGKVFDRKEAKVPKIFDFRMK